MRFLIVGIGIAAMSATSAYSQTCDAQVGRNIQVTPFDALVAQAPTVEPKGEFETTAEFEARKAAATRTAPKNPVFVELTPATSTRGLTYDADRAVFQINDYVFNADSYYTELRTAFGSPLRTNGFGSLIGVRLGRASEDIGNYEATNAFGAKTLVQRRNVTYYELVEGVPSKTGGSSFWVRPKGTYGDAIVGELPVPIADAQEMKQHLRPIVMFLPKAPFYVEVKSAGPSPTRDFPYDMAITTKALVGDMQCALLIDNRTMTVLWSRPTY